MTSFNQPNSTPHFSQRNTRSGPVFSGRDGFVGVTAACTVLMLTVALAAGAMFTGEIAISCGMGMTGVALAWPSTIASRFRLILHEQGPKLTYSFLGIPFRVMHLPLHVQARREGLEDWGDDGDNRTEAMCALSGPATAAMDELWIGTRADRDTLPDAVNAALRCRYAGRKSDPRRLDRNAPWTFRLQGYLSANICQPVATKTVCSTTTYFAGLRDWEAPSWRPIALLVAVVAIAVSTAYDDKAATFSLAFTTLVVTAWWLLQLLRCDRIEATFDSDDALLTMTMQQRWFGVACRTTTLQRPMLHWTRSWYASTPTELSMWSETDLRDHAVAVIDPVAAMTWQAAAATSETATSETAATQLPAWATTSR